MEVKVNGMYDGEGVEGVKNGLVREVARENDR